jgi:hypothetical protein
MTEFSNPTGPNMFRTTRYTIDQSNQPSLDQDKNAEPSELDARSAADEFANPTSSCRYFGMFERYFVAVAASPHASARMLEREKVRGVLPFQATPR